MFLILAGEVVVAVRVAINLGLGVLLGLPSPQARCVFDGSDLVGTFRKRRSAVSRPTGQPLRR